MIKIVNGKFRIVLGCYLLLEGFLGRFYIEVSFLIGKE